MKSVAIESLGIFNSQILKPGMPLSRPRQTTVFELELPLEDGGVSYIEGEASPIATRTFICAKPGQMRHTRFPFLCAYIHVRTTDAGLQEALSALPSFVTLQDPRPYKSLLEEMRQQEGDSRAGALMRQSLLLKLLAFLMRESAGAPAGISAGNARVMTKAFAYIDENLAEPLRLEDIAAHVALSPIYFHNCFKKATGKTLHTYIEDKRIERSISLMLTTDMPLAQIAYSCGFSSQSYYSYVFKRKMHTTPRQYIQMQNSRYLV